MKPSIQELVRLDLVMRERLGQERYGTSLYAYNGRSAILDAYEEALDLALYLRQVIEEMTVGDGTIPDTGTILPPHFAQARQHAAGECGWYCDHDDATGLPKATEPGS